MKPLARFWTWVGQAFIPLAVGWAVFVRNGFGEKLPPDGVLISRGYWGVLVTLLAASGLVWTFACYAAKARKARARTIVPPNTAFEEPKDRNLFLSYGTVLVFTLSVLAALILFGTRYSESLVHGWDARVALKSGFFASRQAAHAAGCSAPPCFAVGPRIVGNGTPIFGVNEYILYWTDGILMFEVLLLLSGLAFLGLVLLKKPYR